MRTELTTARTAESFAVVRRRPAGLVTRDQNIGGGRGNLAAASGRSAPVNSLVTREEALQGPRYRRVLRRVAIVLGFFPPLWPVSITTWLILRRRPKPRSMRLVRKSVAALNQGHTGPAIKQLQEAHLLDPANCDALYWLGLLLSRQRRPEEAADALSLVADRVPGLPEVESALVDAYIEMGDAESAIYHAQRLLDAAPYESESLLKLAGAFEAAGKLSLAIEALQLAHLKKRKLDDGLLQIHYRLGELHEQCGDEEGALSHFKTVYANDISFLDVRDRVDALEPGASSDDE